MISLNIFLTVHLFCAISSIFLECIFSNYLSTKRNLPIFKKAANKYGDDCTSVVFQGRQKLNKSINCLFTIHDHTDAYDRLVLLIDRGKNNTIPPSHFCKFISVCKYSRQKTVCLFWRTYQFRCPVGQPASETGGRCLCSGLVAGRSNSPHLPTQQIALEYLYICTQIYHLHICAICNTWIDQTATELIIYAWMHNIITKVYF